MISHFEDPSGPLFGKKTSKTAFLAVFTYFWQKRGFFTVFFIFCRVFEGHLFKWGGSKNILVFTQSAESCEFGVCYLFIQSVFFVCIYFLKSLSFGHLILEKVVRKCPIIAMDRVLTKEKFGNFVIIVRKFSEFQLCFRRVAKIQNIVTRTPLFLNFWIFLIKP